jgi:hypothetical protein
MPLNRLMVAMQHANNFICLTKRKWSYSQAHRYLLWRLWLPVFPPRSRLGTPIRSSIDCTA